MNFFQIVSLVSYSMILVFFEHYLLLMINDYFLTVIQTQLLVGSFQMFLKDSRSNCILLRENSKSIFFFWLTVISTILTNTFSLATKFFFEEIWRWFISFDKELHEIFKCCICKYIYIYTYILYTHICIYIYKLNIYYYIFYYYIHKPSKTYKFGT